MTPGPERRGDRRRARGLGTTGPATPATASQSRGSRRRGKPAGAIRTRHHVKVFVKSDCSVDHRTSASAKPSQRLAPTVWITAVSSRGCSPITCSVWRTARAAASSDDAVEDPALANDVVRHDDCAGTGQPDRPLQVREIVLLVRVDEHQVERAIGHASATCPARHRPSPPPGRRHRRAPGWPARPRRAWARIPASPPAPAGPRPRASQMVLKPPSVPISRMRRACIAPASSAQELALLRPRRRCAAVRRRRWPPAPRTTPDRRLPRVLSRKASTSCGVGLSVMPT